MDGMPLSGVSVAEIGDGFGVSIAGLLLGELGASVVKLSDEPTATTAEYAIFNRHKQIRANEPAQRATARAGADVVLVEAPWDTESGDGAGAIVVRFADGRGGSGDLLSPTETMLAEAQSGIQSLQLGHRDGPYCLASPIAGYGAGVLGALNAACGLLALARGARSPWAGRVSYLDGTLAFQSLSASFVRDSVAEPPRPRYTDPYSVSFSPLLRFHRAADGWVFIGAISPHMWVSLFGMIGRPDLLDHPDLQGVLPFNIAVQAVGEEVAAAISAWVATRPVDAIVDELTTAGVVSAPVLSDAAFLDHPQAAANGLPTTVDTADGPQLQVGNFIGVTPGTGPAAPLPPIAGDLPLAGLRVIDVSRHAAGPICGRVLADLGADVIRIETPDGEPNRAIGMTFAATNRGKLSLGLDISRPEGRDVLRRLVAGADVVLTNALPDAARKLGIDPQTVAEVNPAALVLTILGFGRKPPFGGRRVVDAAAQALSGQALAEGGGQSPVGCTGGFLDNGAGWLAALGGVAALYRRHVAGVPSAVETSLLSTSAFIQMHRMARPTRGAELRLDEPRTGYTWAQRLYRLADGWICVAANDAAQRAALTAVAAEVGVSVADGETALDLPALTAVLGGWDTAEVTRRFAAHGLTAWTEVSTLDGLARRRDDLFIAVPQSPWGTVLQPRRLPEFTVADHALTGAPPRPGEHNDQVWTLFGFDQGDRDRLVDLGVMRSEPPTVSMFATSV